MRATPETGASKKWRSSGRRGGNRGVSLSLFVALTIPVWIIIVGIAVDSLGQIAMEQEARSVAAHAARAGGQAVANVYGGSVEADPARAQIAAETYLAASGFEGEVAVSGDVVTVTVDGEYRCLFLSLISINQLPVHAEATASLIQTYEGQEP